MKLFSTQSLFLVIHHQSQPCYETRSCLEFVPRHHFCTYSVLKVSILEIYRAMFRFEPRARMSGQTSMAPTILG